MVVDFEEHIKPYRQLLVIAFAGGPQNVFQFRNVLEDAPCSYILMRDSTQHYNHYGVAGIGDRSAVIEYIRGFKQQNYEIKTIGVSSGAYPALLYGQLVPVSEIIVFSALTSRQADGFDPADHHLIVDPANPDVELLPFFKQGPIPRVQAFISDGPDTRLDRQMIERIGITPVVVPGFAHGELARGMRDLVMLKELLS